jgi:hypothetical protein
MLIVLEKRKRNRISEEYRTRNSERTVQKQKQCKRTVLPLLPALFLALSYAPLLEKSSNQLEADLLKVSELKPLFEEWLRNKRQPEQKT